MEDSGMAKRIKDLRSRVGFSQEQLAEKSGLSMRTVQRIENGNTLPRGDTLRRIAMAMQVSPDEIIDWQVQEDKNVLTMLNLSQLGFMAFPILGIIIPLAIWIAKKDSIKHVDQHGKAILNFQISWAILLFLIYIWPVTYWFFPFFFETVELLAVVIVLYVYNALLIAFNAYRIHKGKVVRYQPAFRFLR